MLTVSRIVITGATVYGDADFAPLYADLVGREVPLAAVYELARRITAKYGAAGYVLSRAIVPPQNFGRANAVVQIQVVEGYVDKVVWPMEKLARYRNFFDRLHGAHHRRPAGQHPHARALSAARERPAGPEIRHDAQALADASECLDADRGGHREAHRRDRPHRQPRHEQRGPWQYLGSATVNNIIGRARGVHRHLCGNVPGRGAAIPRRRATGRCSTARGSPASSTRATASAGRRDLLRALEYKTRSAIVEAGLTYPVIRTRETNLYLTALGFMTNDDSFQVGARSPATASAASA